MRIILRYFHNPKTGELVTSVGDLAFALKHKCRVKNVIHWHDNFGWLTDGLIRGFLLLRSRLLSSFWSSCTITILAFLAVVFLWWLPIGLPIRWGWAAFGVLVSLPTMVACLGLRNMVKVLILNRRMNDFLASAMEAGSIMASPMACPTMLLSEQKEKPVKRWPALVSLALLLVFMNVRMAIPLRGFAVIVHDIDGGEFSTEEIYRLAPDEYWEYAPRFIRGTAYGMLYYEEGVAQVLVLNVDYILENSKHRSPKPVRDQVQIWVSVMANNLAMNIRSWESVDLDMDELTAEIKEGIESEAVQAALHRSVKEAAGENLEEHFTTLDFEVRWISIDEYIKKVR